ncbi:hypothetical protein LTR50_007678 [Elasticomyces elasticus]|nr:hypothetical protein LTR50_007678 [Elasticomyces elasticus]
MPKILAYTPPFLLRQSPGFDFFQPSANSSGKQDVGKKIDGPIRTIATRGTEVFAVVGGEIRWSDLVLLKERWEEKEQKSKNGPQRKEGGPNRRGTGGNEEEEKSYRILKVPISSHLPIRQLIISPCTSYLAILTSHTAHVAILPPSTALTAADTSPIRPRAFQLGPTSHVLETSPIVSALWHPLSPPGISCLVTVTKDATIRLWELNPANRQSFSEPALAIDLQKLANATSYSSEEDVSASRYGDKKGFSPDDVDMEVAAACFAGQGAEGENGWASMTVWFAMTQGDVYALCPFLPSRWAPTATIVPSLSTAVVAKKVALENGEKEVGEHERMVYEAQYAWLSDIDAQEPIVVSSGRCHEEAEVYHRPSHPGPMPKLQGPFAIAGAGDSELEFGNITDIHVIAARMGEEELMSGEQDAGTEDEESVSVAVVCLTSSSGNVYVCLDLEGVEGQWLPKQTKSHSSLATPDSDDFAGPSLLLLETVDLMTVSQPTESSYPMFTPDPMTSSVFHVTLPTGIYTLSLDWMQDLEDELATTDAAGSNFRIGLWLETAKAKVTKSAKIDPDQTAGSDTFVVPACIALWDSDLGHMLLTHDSTHQPHAVTLETPTRYAAFAPVNDTRITDNELPQLQLEARPPYLPPQSFFEQSQLPALLESVDKRRRETEIKYSPAVLKVLADAHRVLSAETYRLGLAAADLFRRCERLAEELKRDVVRQNDVTARIEAVIGDDEFTDEETDGGDMAVMKVGKERIEERVERARERRRELRDRAERLRARIAGFGGTELSVKERAWKDEVESLAARVLPPERGEDQIARPHDEQQRSGSLARRFDAVRRLKRDLVAHANELHAEDAEVHGAGDGLGESMRALRRQKVQQVLRLLERESALVEGVVERLGRLGGLG